MKKILLLSTAAIMSGMCAMAQSTSLEATLPSSTSAPKVNIGTAMPIGMVTKDGDTVGRYHASPTADTATRYTYNSPNSGFATGTNSFGDNAYAERYDFPGTDSSLQIIAVAGMFGGNLTATATVNFVVWNATTTPPAVPGRTNWHYLSLPNTALSTQSVTRTEITPYLNGGTFVKMLATQPTVGGSTTTKSAFVGFSMTYSHPADTFFVYQALGGHRYSTLGTTSATDTVLNTQNVVRSSAGTWDDYYYHTSLPTHFFVAPIFVVHYTGMAEIAQKGLAVFGNYPNPATSSTNIKFSLESATDVTIIINDITGRTVQTIQLPKQTSGEHVQNIDVTSMSSGTYIYQIRTSAGGSIAAQMTVK